MRSLIILACLMIPVTAEAQVPLPTPQQPRQSQDTIQAADTIPVPPFRIHPPVPPLGALWRSMLVPGWGQSALGRRITGAFFVFVEGVAIAMTIKASHQLAYLRAIDDERAPLKKQEIQDWIVVLVFNHLIAGAEAFVSAQLWDFPPELEARMLPSGDAGVGLRVPIRFR